MRAPYQAVNRKSIRIPSPPPDRTPPPNNPFSIGVRITKRGGRPGNNLAPHRKYRLAGRISPRACQCAVHSRTATSTRNATRSRRHPRSAARRRASAARRAVPCDPSRRHGRLPGALGAVAVRSTVDSAGEAPLARRRDRSRSRSPNGLPPYAVSRETRGFRPSTGSCGGLSCPAGGSRPVVPSTSNATSHQSLWVLPWLFLWVLLSVLPWVPLRVLLRLPPWVSRSVSLRVLHERRPATAVVAASDSASDSASGAAVVDAAAGPGSGPASTPAPAPAPVLSRVRPDACW
ncbi:membrane protein [Streptomyces noursei ATCC 11455]|nr:membrane protein [Streptomyces noursei ATCC 11455]